MNELSHYVNTYAVKLPTLLVLVFYQESSQNFMRSIKRQINSKPVILNNTQNEQHNNTQTQPSLYRESFPHCKLTQFQSHWIQDLSECIIILTKLSTMQCKNVIRRFSCNKRQIWYAVIDTCNFNYFLINCAALIWT